MKKKSMKLIKSLSVALSMRWKCKNKDVTWSTLKNRKICVLFSLNFQNKFKNRKKRLFT